ncbi:hypothetical protein BZA05DRAFT_66376 [Tricharina praecox]|uniref:uncharacterized protein n=1 Tax=Tricharina praecox TaxID=43433 RepID=UPI00221F232D|nr:uncharacterized protein BZA05DRAFT_66376 [Tricharina praecox]KAI5850008.1 hypothetical protein BZA05DRAFT_66376 [Tricharina praecox]
MKYSTALFIAAAVATVNAQLDGLPTCATACAMSSLGSTDCSDTNFKCICGKEDFLSSISGCVNSACSVEDQKKSLVFAQDFCSRAGAPIPSAVIASLTATASSTASASGSRASGVSASATAVSSALSSAAAAAETGAASKFGISGLGLGAAAAALFLL